MIRSSLRSVALLLLATFAAVGFLSCVNPRARVDPEQARAAIASHLPSRLQDRQGWQDDIFAAFDALGLDPTA